ncbi:redoxin domain-containing protein [Fodinibius halophilus]|uniref:Redoxin domain-containing protein n=1 Tax=Fodinibius halophilus TaxID=1736908 RepID=A0A6M1T1S0_9BACT|nr:redoxin domain-containing protein [Fodinibius halophilus]NGP89426.1 redoxin domain-containing protein [Fodinibius halophilus]
MRLSIFFALLTILLPISLLGQNISPDSVKITFKVSVPESTPENATIYWAGSLNNWDPGDQGFGFSSKEFAQPLTSPNGHWVVTLTAPKGSTHSYKYTRGSIYNAEEKSGFNFRPARKVEFDHDKTVHDTVEAWRDKPPKSLSDSWPIIQLDTANPTITYNGTVMNGSSTLLYDKQMGSKFVEYTDESTSVKKVPESFTKTVHYYQKVSATTDDLQLITAAKTNTDTLWHVYVDTDGNKIIEKSEHAFTIADSNNTKWSGPVPVRNIIDGETVIDSVILKVKLAKNLPANYRSSAIKGAPDLIYGLPFKERIGTLNNNPFYVISSTTSPFNTFNRLFVDYNNNDTLEIGSGSNEVYVADFNKMHKKKKFYQIPSFQLGQKFWTIADIDPHGRWIRLRPGDRSQKRRALKKGDKIPSWKGITINNNAISSKQLQGQYVLLDFWGSWCGPCIDAIPKLQKAYNQFKTENFEIVGFAYENEKSLTKTLEKYKMPWFHILDEEGDFGSQFLVQGYPTYYLVDPDGKIVETENTLQGKKLIPTLEKHLK